MYSELVSASMKPVLEAAARGEALERSNLTDGLTNYGLLDADRKITPAGVDAFEELGGEVVTYNLLTLGTQLTGAKDENGNRTKLMPGSKLLVLYSNRRRGVLWYYCHAGKDLGIMTVGQNRLHKFSELKMPKDHPMEVTYHAPAS